MIMTSSHHCLFLQFNRDYQYLNHLIPFYFVHHQPKQMKQQMNCSIIKFHLIRKNCKNAKINLNKENKFKPSSIINQNEKRDMNMVFIVPFATQS